MGSVMDLSVLQRRAPARLPAGECLMTVRGIPGVFHLQTEKARHIRELYGGLPCVRQPVPLQEKSCRACWPRWMPEQMQYHLARIRADPYNIPVLAENEQMLQQLHITAAVPLKLCLLGEMLAGAEVPLSESRQIGRPHTTAI